MGRARFRRVRPSVGHGFNAGGGGIGLRLHDALRGFGALGGCLDEGVVFDGFLVKAKQNREKGFMWIFPC